MDLAAGAKEVIVAMEHTDRRDEAKIVETCTYPITGKEFGGLTLVEIIRSTVRFRFEDTEFVRELQPAN